MAIRANERPFKGVGGGKGNVNLEPVEGKAHHGPAVGVLDDARRIGGHPGALVAATLGLLGIGYAKREIRTAVVAVCVEDVAFSGSSLGPSVLVNPHAHVVIERDRGVLVGEDVVRRALRSVLGKRGVHVIRCGAAGARTDGSPVLTVNARGGVVIHLEAHGAAGNIGKGDGAAARDVLAHRSGVLKLASNIHTIGNVSEVDAKLVEGVACAVRKRGSVRVELGVDAAFGRHVPGVEEVERDIGIDELVAALVLLGSNELPGKLHEIRRVLLNARALAVGVVGRHSCHAEVDRHAVALRETGTFPALVDRLVALIDRARGIVGVHDLPVLIEQRGIHLRMRVASSVRLDDVDEGGGGGPGGRRSAGAVGFRSAGGRSRCGAIGGRRRSGRVVGRSPRGSRIRSNNSIDGRGRTASPIEPTIAGSASLNAWTCQAY